MPTGQYIRNFDQECYLYRIQHRDHPEKDYVGIAVKPKKRWREHKASARRGSKGLFHRCLAKYGEEAFTWTIIARYRTRRIAGQVEIFCRTVLKWGSLNLTSGGDGIINLPDSILQVKSEKMKAFWQSPGVRESQTTKIKAAVGKESYKQNLSAAQNTRWADPEARARQSAVHKIVWQQPERKQQLSRMTQSAHTPEAKRKRSESMKARWKAKREAKAQQITPTCTENTDKVK